MKNTSLNDQIYFIQDEANRLDQISCKLRLLSDLLVEKNNIELTEEHSLGLASILNNAYEEIINVKNHLKEISK